ncbi:hypothetical protein BC936DRAFT_141329 [Jimgerdemannia flammicorona]|uniref:Zn(2)-C6 fungal-type domain-containing protein n=1 Tax=Jimgerdemannia flammicorona TaxID=994334 RepID=A0A433DGC8_9FUNG|nr:hypothetical protein BC936DRAFT_141329 [Jimgerdemannia flammicorona]
MNHLELAVPMEIEQPFFGVWSSPAETDGTRILSAPKMDAGNSSANGFGFGTVANPLGSSEIQVGYPTVVVPMFCHQAYPSALPISPALPYSMLSLDACNTSTPFLYLFWGPQPSSELQIYSQDSIPYGFPSYFQSSNEVEPSHPHRNISGQVPTSLYPHGTSPLSNTIPSEVPKITLPPTESLETRHDQVTPSAIFPNIPGLKRPRPDDGELQIIHQNGQDSYGEPRQKKEHIHSPLANSSKPKRLPSCLSCHRSKKRCDRGLPCGECMRKDTECLYPNYETRPSSWRSPLPCLYSDSMHQKISGSYFRSSIK